MEYLKQKFVINTAIVNFLCNVEVKRVKKIKKI